MGGEQCSIANTKCIDFGVLTEQVKRSFTPTLQRLVQTPHRLQH